MTRRTLYFDAASGDVLLREQAHSIMKAQRFIAGLHLIQFGERWLLRWLYFLVGLAGCALVFTGLIFWIETRRAKHEKQGRLGVRLVEAHAIGATTGIVIATLSLFVINRLLPLGLANRAQLETSMFYASWLVTFAHAWLRPKSGWKEQTWVIAALAALAVVLNAVTTGDHLLHTLRAGNWVIASIDATLVASAILAVVAARKLQSGAPLLQSNGATRRASAASSAAASGAE